MRPSRMVPLSLAAGLMLCGCPKSAATNFTTGGKDILVEKGKTFTWGFDAGTTSSLPEDFISVLGKWTVQAEGSAPSAPHVLRQSDSFGDPDFPRVVVKDLTFTDLTVRVRCRPEAGSTDQACGLIFRLKDSDNYFITRANALEGNVNLYRVVDGDRQQITGADAAVASGQWHTLEAGAHGATLTVSWDGKPLISTEDTTFAKGKIGLWTKADSVTAFDDLEATAE